jgi:hypothetical protein
LKKKNEKLINEKPLQLKPTHHLENRIDGLERQIVTLRQGSQTLRGGSDNLFI